MSSKSPMSTTKVKFPQRLACQIIYHTDMRSLFADHSLQAGHEGGGADEGKGCASFSTLADFFKQKYGAMHFRTCADTSLWYSYFDKRDDGSSSGQGEATSDVAIFCAAAPEACIEAEGLSLACDAGSFCADTDVGHAGDTAGDDGLGPASTVGNTVHFHNFFEVVNMRPNLMKLAKGVCSLDIGTGCQCLALGGGDGPSERVGDRLAFFLMEI